MSFRMVARLERISPDDTDVSILTPEERIRYDGSSTRRRVELLAGRRVVRDLVERSGWCSWRGIEVSSSGQPRLRGADQISVSISHSRDWLLAAIARGRRVGVDVEVVTAVFDQPALIKLACSKAELADLRAADRAERRAAMADLWTNKEAVLKARGRGLADDPRLVSGKWATGMRATGMRLSTSSANISVAFALLPSGIEADLVA